MKYLYTGYRRYTGFHAICSVCNDAIGFKKYTLLTTRPIHEIGAGVRVCHECTSSHSEVQIRNLIEIYNDTFSDTIEIIEYLKLALGKIQ